MALTPDHYPLPNPLSSSGVSEDLGTAPPASKELDGAQLEVVGVGDVAGAERPEQDHAVARTRERHVVPLLVHAAELRRRGARACDQREQDHVALVALERRGVPHDDAVARELRVREPIEQHRAQQPRLLDARERNDADRGAAQVPVGVADRGFDVLDQFLSWRCRRAGRPVGGLCRKGDGGVGAGGKEGKGGGATRGRRYTPSRILQR